MLVIPAYTYKHENDIEKFLPLALALAVFNRSDIDVVLPGRF